MFAQKRKKRPYSTYLREKRGCKNNNPTDFKSIKQKTKIEPVVYRGFKKKMFYINVPITVTFSSALDILYQRLTAFL